MLTSWKLILISSGSKNTGGPAAGMYKLGSNLLIKLLTELNLPKTFDSDISLYFFSG